MLALLGDIEDLRRSILAELQFLSPPPTAVHIRNLSDEVMRCSSIPELHILANRWSCTAGLEEATEIAKQHLR